MSTKNPIFRLLNYKQRDESAGRILVGLVLSDAIVPLEALAAHHPGARQLLEVSAVSELTPGIQGLLTNWEQSYQILSELADFITRQGVENGPWQGDLVSLDAVHVLSPV